MRIEFANAMINNFSSQPDQVFMTGDLGYKALENVREIFADRFINAGIAEQNMVTMAAALAADGFLPWVYSISPFVTHRPYEQIRNDVCHHNLPVKLVGNGGGYGYGIMGSTHHNLEDIGIMRVLPNMKVYVPFTKNDVGQCVKLMILDKAPNYLRLNLATELKTEVQEFAPWRKLKSGKKAVVIGTGPVVGNLFELDSTILDDLEIWLVSMFPLQTIPAELIDSLRDKKIVISIEEHNSQCGLHETLAAELLLNNCGAISYHGLSANGYPSGKYGSQKWHQEENNLGGEGLKNKIIEFLK